VGAASVGVGRGHPQRVDGDRGGRGDAFKQAVWPVLVREESDRPAVHPKDRPTELQVLMDRMEEQAVAAEGHDDLAVAGVDQVVAGGEVGLGCAGCCRAGRDAGDARPGRDRGHEAIRRDRSASRRPEVWSGCALAGAARRAHGFLVEGSAADAAVALCACSRHRRHEPAEQIDRERPEQDPDKGLRSAVAVWCRVRRGQPSSSLMGWSETPCASGRPLACRP
jgi:hypothetical protein